ncbi:hypothetical protein SynA1524_02094 [Synechococcus sp. A15-24]|nr:hypothetical protein SynA1524_02094 [Synechococcus sp. A15-24]
MLKYSLRLPARQWVLWSELCCWWPIVLSITDNQPGCV